MTASPRTSSWSGNFGPPFNRNGSDLMVRAFPVTSFSDPAISPCKGLLESAACVVGGHGKSVQLQFSYVFVRLRFQETAYACIKFSELLLIERVVQAQHGRAVGYFDEALARFPPYPLRDGVRAPQSG